MSCVILLLFPRGLCPRAVPRRRSGGTPARRATHCLLPPLPGATGEARAGTAAARDQAKEDHSAGPGKGAAPIPAAGALGGPRPANYSPPSGDGPGQAKGCPPHPGRQKRPQRPHSRHGGTAKPHGGRPAVPPGPAPRTALSLAGGAAPPALRAAAKTDRGRPATAHGGPGPTPPGPDDHQPPGARARRGAARASRAIFMPPHSFWSRGRP